MQDIFTSNNCLKKTYHKDETIAIEGNQCTLLGFIESGSIEVSKNYPSGNNVIINTFGSGNVFGESILFSNIGVYPADVKAVEDTTIIFLSKEDLITLFSRKPEVLNNFLNILSNRIVMLSKRIELLSHTSIREKISAFLLAEYQNQKNYKLNFPYTRKKMAEILNIPRPSLSRELNNMKVDKIIDYEKNTIKILSLEDLEEIIIDGA